MKESGCAVLNGKDVNLAFAVSFVQSFPRIENRKTEPRFRSRPTKSDHLSNLISNPFTKVLARLFRWQSVQNDVARRMLRYVPPTVKPHEMTQNTVTQPPY